MHTWSYRKINNLLGWIVFGIAAIVYLLCCEPTVSFWDCGEYISTAYKLEVGHPPGAPFFQLLARFFSFFSFGDTSKVALMINYMSTLVSAFTILFLFWTITLLAKKVILRSSQSNILSNAQQIAVFGSAMVGSLAYAFSDTFWFSAVEAEVYALSSLFTAITFWAILKWEEQANEKYSVRWILLIAYLIGISIGIHLLNLLTIPAIVFVYYFKQYKPSIKGIIITSIASVALLAVLLWLVIPYLLILSGNIDKLFVNRLNFPIGFGTIVYFVVLIGLIIGGIVFSQKKQKVILNTVLLCFTFLLIGYSSFVILVVRSNANVPINENKPNDAFALSSYLGREQYEQTPLLYGLYYTAPAIGYKDGKPLYAKQYNVISQEKVVASFFDKYEAQRFIEQQKTESLYIKPKYALAFDSKASELIYLDDFYTFFPRMWSSQASRNYEIWGNVKGTPIEIEEYSFIKPTFVENVRFFFSYQVGYMYFRYFMWNFSGKFNDIQGHGDLQNGEWITGFSFLDKHLIDSYENLPEELGSKGHNKYYMLPLLLGLIGFFFQINKDPKNNIVLSLLFFFTGIAIVIYLNQSAYQPRERDYAYAASFYAFSIWIGLGTLCLIQSLLKRINKSITSIVVSLLCLLVPALMAKENWNDHNRSGRTIALQMAINYLESCAPNAILFTNADNDTFPLWYAQEVEGIRTDVRVVNLSLLNTDWYIDACKRKTYESDPVPFSLSKNKYVSRNREVILIKEDQQKITLNEIIDFVNEDDNTILIDKVSGKKMHYIPSNTFALPVNKSKLIKEQCIPENLHNKIQDSIIWSIESDYITKSQLMQLDLLAHFNWERPIYFVDTWHDAYLGLQDYFQVEGFAYRLMPVKNTPQETATDEIGYVNTDIMYKNMMSKFRWKDETRKNIYLDETARRAAINFRDAFVRLSNALIDENKKDLALNVINKAFEVLPNNYLTYNYSNFLLARNYLKIDKPKKALPVLNTLMNQSNQKLNYYFALKKRHQAYMREDIFKTFVTLNDIFEIALECKLKEIENSIMNVYFTIVPEYLDFCDQQLTSYFSMPNANEYTEDILKFMQSVSFVMKKSQDFGKQPLFIQAQEIMKQAIKEYNSIVDNLEQTE